MNVRYQLALFLFQQNEPHIKSIKKVIQPIYEERENEIEEIFEDVIFDKTNTDFVSKKGKYEKFFCTCKVVFEYDAEVKEMKVFYIDFEQNVLGEKEEILKMIETYKYNAQERIVECTNYIRVDKSNNKIFKIFLTTFVES